MRAVAGSSDDHRESFSNLVPGLVLAVLTKSLLQQLCKLILEPRQRDTILWSLRPGNARLNRREIEFQQRAVIAFVFARCPKHSLRSEVVSDQIDLFISSAGRFVIFAGGFVDGEETHR